MPSFDYTTEKWQAFADKFPRCFEKLGGIEAENYGGKYSQRNENTRPGLIVRASSTPNSELMAKANDEALCRLLNAACQTPSVGEPKDELACECAACGQWEVFSSSHWFVRSVDHYAIHVAEDDGTPTPLAAVMEGVFEKLEDHPILDDSLYSDMLAEREAVDRSEWVADGSWMEMFLSLPSECSGGHVVVRPKSSRSLGRICFDVEANNFSAEWQEVISCAVAYANIEFPDDDCPYWGVHEARGVLESLADSGLFSSWDDDHKCFILPEKPLRNVCSRPNPDLPLDLPDVASKDFRLVVPIAPRWVDPIFPDFGLHGVPNDR